MPVLSVVNYRRAHWTAADPNVRAALLANIGLLRVTNVHIGQAGDIEFNVGSFTNVPAGAANSILSTALLITAATLAVGTTVELHGHFNTVIDQQTREARKEIASIAFKLSAVGAERPAYLGWIDRASIPAANRTALDREINRRRWRN
ncbi:hypothetical protein [Agathobaculum sp.]|uniref:hypothetical protein n=1 Tax=Agathobaculum sp. TaxID=2048138 RepID=UPI002A800E70|nr:hypothetical protein [Agathobaculum sp.]MDY3617644.1 hypothetical protein [Agathobaculum sp.]